IDLKALGEGHPDTAASYKGLGLIVDRFGKTDEALDALTTAVRVFERARLQGTNGLDSAPTSEKVRSPALAVALAHAGRAADAWASWERGLARGVLDETAGRA